MNDRDFVEGLRHQDAAAVRHLSECLLPSVWRFVYFRVKGDQHLAEDILGDTALALIKAATDPEIEIVSPGAWLRTVATHKIQDHFRAVARVQHLIDQAAAIAERNTVLEPSSQEEADERRRTVRKVMDDLPEQYRLALEWKYVDRLSVREIAARMATTEKSAEAILFRARRAFRDQAGKFHHEDFPVTIVGVGNSASEIGKQGNDECAPVSGRTGNDSRIELETPASTGLDELQQRQS